MRQSVFLNKSSIAVVTVLVITMALGFWRCDDHFVELHFPSDATMDVNLDYANLSSDYNARIRGIGEESGDITEQGFTWSKSSKDPKPGTDSTLLVHQFQRDQDEYSFDTLGISGFSYDEPKYYVRAFVKFENSEAVVEGLRQELDDNGYYLWPVDSFDFFPIEVQIIADTVVNNSAIVLSQVIKQNSDALQALGGTIEKYGLLWSETNANPLIGGDDVSDTTNMESSVETITYANTLDLCHNTSYHIRAYAFVDTSNGIVSYSDVVEVVVEDGWIRRSNTGQNARAFVSGVAVQANPQFNFAGMGCLGNDCGTEFMLWFVTFQPGKINWSDITHRMSDTLIAYPRARGVGTMNKDMFIYGLGYSDQSGLRSDFSVKSQFGKGLDIDPFPGDGRVNAVAFTLGDTTYVGMGMNSNGVYNDFRILYFDSVDSRWKWKTDVITVGSSGLAGAVAVTAEDKAYILGGTEQFTSDSNVPLFYKSVTKDFYSFTSNNEWEALPVPEDFEPRAEAIGYYLDGKLYFGLGRDVNGELLRDFWSYDPNTLEWTQLEDYPTGRAAGNVLINNEKAFVGGGWLDVSGEEVASREYWEYVPLSAGCPE